MEAMLLPTLSDAEAYANPPASLTLACSRRRETTRLAILRKGDISDTRSVKEKTSTAPIVP